MRSKTKCVFQRKVRVFFDTAESDTYDTLAFYESEILCSRSVEEYCEYASEPGGGQKMVISSMPTTDVRSGSHDKHFIPSTDSGYGGGTICSRGVRIVTPDGRKYIVGGMKEGYSGRREMGGPMVPGPWAYLIEIPQVIHKCRGLRRDFSEKKLIHVKEGDSLTIYGCDYRIVPATTRGYDLLPVDRPII